MSKTTRPVIDCNNKPDLLAGLPVAGTVMASRTARTLMADLDIGWTIETAPALPASAPLSIDPYARIATIATDGLTPQAVSRSPNARNMLALRVFSAIRAAWLSDRMDDARAAHRPDLWLLLGRMAAADTSVMAMRMAYETGDDALWHHALGGDTGDMAAIYTETLADRACRHTDHPALRRALLVWFASRDRQDAADNRTLAEMDDTLADLSMSGSGRLTPQTLWGLCFDPLSGVSYLGDLAADLAGDPAWRDIRNPLTEAHFLQVINDVGTLRIGNIALRDKKLAARLFPDVPVHA